MGLVDSGGSKQYVRDGVGVTSPVLSDGASTFTAGGERTAGVSKTLHSGLKNDDLQTDVSGSVIGERLYDAFGNVVSNSGAWSSHSGYGGKFGYQDDADSSLKLLGHRYYDSSTGRFLTRDPIGDGQNWYVYCENSPVQHFDAEGLWKAVIIVGKLNWWEHAAKTLIIEALKKWLQSLGATEIVVIEDADEAKLIRLLSDPKVEGFAYFGHGVSDEQKKDGSIRAWQSELAGEDVLDATTVSKIAKRRKKKIRHAIIFSCNSGLSSTMWLDIAEWVYTWGHQVSVLDLVKHNYDPETRADLPKKIGGGSVRRDIDRATEVKSIE